MQTWGLSEDRDVATAPWVCRRWSFWATNSWRTSPSPCYKNTQVVSKIRRRLVEETEREASRRLIETWRYRMTIRVRIPKALGSRWIGGVQVPPMVAEAADLVTHSLQRLPLHAYVEATNREF